MTEFTMKKMMIGVVLFSVFFSLLGGAFYGMMSTYDVSTSKDFESTYSKLDAITNTSTEIGEQYQNTGLSSTNPFIVAGQAIFQAGKISYSAATIPLEIIRTLSNNLFLPIPKIFFYAIITLLIISVVYAVAVNNRG